MTSLEHCGGSVVSESCSKEFLTKRSEIGGVPSIAGSETKLVVAGEREIFRVPDTKPIRRSLAKKKSTLPELEAMHQSLLEHRKFLLKKMEGKQRSKVVLVAKNRELKELKTLPELEAMHQSLLEHRKFLLKKMEAKRRSKVALVAKNRELKELKMRLESRKRPNTAPLPEEELSKQIRLPDLNVPLVSESD